MGKQAFATGSKWAAFIFLTLLSIVFLFPLIALIVASFKPSQDLLRFGLNVHITAEVFTLKNYTFILSGNSGHYFDWYKNSFLITILHTGISLLFSSAVGYALAVYQFRGRNLTFALVLLVMMIPVEIMMLPMYRLMTAMKLINTYWGVILPFIVAPLPVFFFRQYASGLPKDFMDAARMDGCTEYGIFFRIMMPLMGPAFAAMAILQALLNWNNFLWPLIVLRTNEMFTLPIGLASLLTPYGNNYDVLIAGSVMTIIPVLILYLLFQRYFVAGMTAGGVKG